MHLNEYLKHNSIDDLADRMKTSKWYLYQLRRGHRNPSLEMCRRLEKETGGKVTTSDMRPDWVQAIND